MDLSNLNIILILCSYFSDVFGFYKLGINYKFLRNYPTDITLYPEIVNHTIEQPLDHFDQNEKRTWQMTYYENLEFWKKGGPIYLFIGGEGPVDPGFLKYGLMIELANETNGAMLLSEHRFYGKTIPLPHKTTNYAFLNSRQALADLAKLLIHQKSLPQFQESKVVVIGGSYPGNLAAWMKLLYPELVNAAIASSAPVLAKADFYEYLETVNDDYKLYGSKKCYDKIVAMFSRYDELFKTSAGIEQLKKEENICDGCDMSKLENKQMFFYEHLGYLMEAAQYGPPEEIIAVCNSIIKSTGDFRRYIRDRNDTFLNYFISFDEAHNCYTYDFDDYIEHAKGFAPWIYQTCTEFGYFQSTSSDKTPFTKNLPVDFFYVTCSRMFGPQFNKERVDEGVKKTNAMYGGLKPNVSQVVFINGDKDPWHRLGITKDLSEKAPARLVHGTGHCADLLIEIGEPRQMIKTRKFVKQLIKKWIGLR